MLQFQSAPAHVQPGTTFPLTPSAQAALRCWTAAAHQTRSPHPPLDRSLRAMISGPRHAKQELKSLSALRDLSEQLVDLILSSFLFGMFPVPSALVL